MMAIDTEHPRVELNLPGSKIQVAVYDQDRMLHCGYLGPRGTYSEQAARELLGDQVAYEPVGTITGVIKRIARREYSLGLVPIENSTEGGVAETLRNLVSNELDDDADFRILSEQVIPIKHVLFGTPHAFQKQILHSHSQAIGQCSRWIDKNLPDGTIVRSDSTAQAVQIAIEKDELAIGSQFAGDLYGAQVLDRDINDLASNHTRFWLLGRGKTEPTGNDRTTTVFSLPNEVGTLVRALSCFTNEGVSIDKPDALPTGTLDEYLYFVSVTGHYDEVPVKNALRKLGEQVWKHKVLGSYRKDMTQINYDPELIRNGWVPR